MIRADNTVPCAVTGNCAAPTKVTAALIRPAITRQHGRRAASLICGFARKPSGDSRLQPVTISIIVGARRLRCYCLVSIQLDAEQVTTKEWKSCRAHRHHQPRSRLGGTHRRRYLCWRSGRRPKPAGSVCGAARTGTDSPHRQCAGARRASPSNLWRTRWRHLVRRRGQRRDGQRFCGESGFTLVSRSREKNRDQIHHRISGRLLPEPSRPASVAL